MSKYDALYFSSNLYNLENNNLTEMVSIDIFIIFILITNQNKNLE